MNIEVSSEAARWYKRELGLEAGACIRFFPRYSSGGGLHPGFSIGIAVEKPIDLGIEQQAEGIKFYMEESDLWYLRGYNLQVQYEESEDDILYIYKQED